MKKVLFITTISGFLQQFELNDVAILQEAGYEVHYASNFHNPVYEVDEMQLQRRGIILHQIDIQKSPASVGKNSKALLQVRRLIKKEQIAMIHCHNPMGGVVGRLAPLGLKKKTAVIYTAHGFHFYKGAPLRNWLLYFPAEYLLARCTDRIITINEEDYRAAGRFHLRKGGYAERIPGVGVRNAHFVPKDGLREKTRKELGIPENAFYLLSVGELNRNKNHKVILKAMATIQDETLYFGICGRGPMGEELKKTARQLGIEKRVMLFGFRNDIPRMLSAADCFVFPSKREGLGVAALEAMAAGLPLITSDCRGTREYMQHGYNGFICRKGTAADYAEAICRLRDDPVGRERMARASLVAARKFDISVTDKIMRKLYGSLSEQQKAAEEEKMSEET